MKRSGWLSALVLSAGLCTAAVADPITGTVKLEGKAPTRQPVAGIQNNKDCAAMHKDPLLDETVVADDDGNLANVVVYLKGDNVKGQAPSEPAVIDQEGCQYIPHVLSMTVGQGLIAKNSDAFLHNVHSLPELNEPDNKAMPTKDENGIKLKPITAAETFKVKCDVHPWMNMWIAVFDHPFHAVTLDDGTFEIDATGLPDGEYTVTAWHEKYKDIAKPGKVTIKGGKPSGPVNLSFTAAGAAADKAAPAEPTVLVSTLAAPAAQADKKVCCEGGCDEKAKPAVAATK